MIKVMLDPGHGGHDPGACGYGLQEKDLTLTISQKIGTLLGEYEGVEVSYTRTDDRYLTLAERANKANQWKADYFMSIHINAGGGTGWESFIHTNASSKSVAYQNVVHAEIMKSIGNVKDRGKKRANYAVLRQTNMPSILTENLFIDNPTDAAKLKDGAFLDKIAEGHVNGIAKTFGLKKKHSASTNTKSYWQLSNGKWFYYDKGVMAKNRWVLHTDNKWYFLQSDGSMATSKWISWKGKWYYVLADGAMATGWIYLNDKWYFLDRKNGGMKTGYITDGGERYFLQDSGALLITDDSGAIQ
ncbi:N-acetylmuramoyl-L-alanine amidase [Neobacillus sedimentimangrovi]|uniref:N-acetylmuramoyl-L-alanine amidase n=1 Tax=Neobacillus sedimentimangrovi TaxID=2699460 RepID=A0ABS8QG07_9BACI|nr:N-acetylmuramoyl-L-alanine amidase [Neobacillus sedimentimangrovi]MCD4838178.1 N-acetylmuramoyl-L-alanine amidase [Neobacillus sedimentimangrovi]